MKKCPKCENMHACMVKKERRTCPKCGSVLEPRFRPGEGWYLWCKKCEERYEERVKEVLKTHG